MSDESRPAELNALESGLKGLTPAAQLNRDAVMFRAGQESMRPRFRLMTGIAAGLLALLPLQAMFWTRPGPERVVYVQTTTPAPEERPAPVALPRREPRPDQTAYIAVRKRMLEKGVDSLPPTEAPPAPRAVDLKSLLAL